MGMEWPNVLRRQLLYGREPRSMWRDKESDEGCSAADASAKNYGVFTYPEFRKEQEKHFPPNVICGQVVKKCADGTVKVDLPAKKHFMFSMNTRDLPHPKQFMRRQSRKKNPASRSNNPMERRHISSILSHISYFKSNQEQMDKLQITPRFPLKAIKTEDGMNDEPPLVSLMAGDYNAQDKGVFALQDHKPPAAMQNKRIRWSLDGKPLNGECIKWCEVERLSPRAEVSPPCRADFCSKSLIPFNMYGASEE